VLTYIVRRLLWLLIVLFGVSVVTFIVIYAVPADPARTFAPNASAQAIANIRHQWGLDQPVWVQYIRYLGRLLHGDLGWSYHISQPVLTAILQRAPATAELAVAGLLMELIIGLPVGIASAVRPYGIVDRTGMILSLIGISMPTFGLGLLLLYSLAYSLGLFPISGFGPGFPWNMQYLFLPALAVGVSGGAYYARLLRSSLLDVLTADYVRTARAKGLSGSRVLLRHALPNAITPVVTQIGLDFGYFLGGVVVVEQVFAWPGIGFQAWQAIDNLDVPMIMGTVLFAALCVTFMNIVIDVLYAVLDPRVRLA
jgi:peptide/nickel transport system permease protein